MKRSASKVWLNGGKARLIGQRPAISQTPNTIAKEISCQAKAERERCCGTETISESQSKIFQLQDRGSNGVNKLQTQHSLLHNSNAPHFTLASAALSAEKCQKSSSFRFSPLRAPDRL